MSDPRPTRSDRTPVSPRGRRLGALVGLLAGLTLAGTLGAPSAFAHTELESSNPADGGTIEQPPTSIQLVFADTVRGADPVFTITVAGAAPVEAPAVIDGATVTADLSGVTLPDAGYPAAWEVGYRLVALDGDAFRGDITFTVAAGSAPVTSASEQTDAPLTSTPESTATPTGQATDISPGTTAPVATPSSSSSSSSSSSTTAAGTTTTSSTDGSTVAPGTATTAAAAESGGGAGWWWFGAVVLVVLVAGGGYWYARGRQGTPPTA